MKNLMILIGVIGIIFILTYAIDLIIDIYKTKHSKLCHGEVTSLKTGYKYPIFRYYINKNEDMELLIYNRFTEHHEWKLIYQFDNPFLVAFVIDKDYAMSHMAQLFTIKLAKNFTKSSKK